MNWKTVVAVGAGMSWAAAGGRAQAVVWSDGFEAPVVAGHALNLSGAFAFGVWTGVAPSHGGNAGVVSGEDNGLAPAEGGQHFNFNGGNPSDRGWIETSMATVQGVDYVLSYAVGRSGALGQLINVKVEVFDGVTGAVINADLRVAPAADAYEVATLGFAGTAAGSVRMRFTDLSGPNQFSDLWIDAVSVSAVGAIPEPGATGAICGAGALLGVLLLRCAAKRNERADSFVARK